MDGTASKMRRIDKQSRNAGLHEEIAIQRDIIRKLKNIVDETGDLGEMLHALKALGSASAQLAYLLKAQQFLAVGEDEELERTLSQALKEVVEEMKGKKP